jgi:hypothetical protein
LPVRAKRCGRMRIESLNCWANRTRVCRIRCVFFNSRTGNWLFLVILVIFGYFGYFGYFGILVIVCAWAIGLTSCFVHSVCAAGTTRMSVRGGCVERLTRTAGEVEVVGSSPGRVVDRRRRRPRAAGTTTTRAGEPAEAEGAIPAGAAGIIPIIPIILIIPTGEAAAARARGRAEAADGGTGSAHPTASEHKTDRIRPPFLSRSQDLSAVHSFTRPRRRE